MEANIKPHRNCKARHDPCPPVVLPRVRKNRSQTPEEHRQMSRQFIEQARCELAKGDRVQASEKIWGAAAHAVKAVSLEQGWFNRSHPSIAAAADILDRAHNSPLINSGVRTASQHHQNFYNNELEATAIQSDIRGVEALVNELDEVAKAKPRPVVVQDDFDRSRVSALLQVPVQRVAVGDSIEGNQLKDAKGQVKHQGNVRIPKRNSNPGQTSRGTTFYNRSKPYTGSGTARPGQRRGRRKRS